MQKIKAVLLLRNAIFVAGAALWTWRSSDFVTGAVNRDFWTCDSFADVVAGTALCDARSADFVAGAALGEPRSADFGRGAGLAHTPSHSDPLVPTPATGPAVATAAGSSADGTAVDQLHETEVKLMSVKCYRNHRGMVGADPLPEADPSPEQVRAMAAKVIRRGGPPYADFT